MLINVKNVVRFLSQKRNERNILIVVVCFALSGCASDVANRYYGAEKYEQKSAAEVELLWSKPARQFTVIADFQSRGETPEDMRRKAAAIGADAVIVTVLGGHYSENEQWAGNDRYKNTYSRIVGTAIKFN